MKRRRLAILHYTAPPVVGGVEAILAEQARQLRKRGYDVRVIAGRGDADVVPELDSRHPEVEKLTASLARGRLDRRLFNDLKARVLTGLRPLLEDREVVIAHNVMTLHMNLPLTAALLEAARPLVAWTHDLTWENPRYRDFQRDQEPYSLLRRPQPGVRYVVISQLRRRELSRLFQVPLRSLSVVPNGIDAYRFLGVGGRTRGLAHQAGFEGAWPLILAPVRITRRKRLELAVRAAGLLRDRLPNLQLVISGPLGAHSADNAAYVRELLELRHRLGLDGVVKLLYEYRDRQGRHPVDARAINELYRLADLVVLTSEAEGFGLPVLEAGLARAPMVCTDIPILREVGGGGVHTFRPDGDGGDVAAAIESALNSRPVRLRRRALETYSWRSVMELTEKLIARA